MLANKNKDVFKRAEGTATSTVTNPSNATVVPEKKFSLSATTDKMGITEEGSVAKGVWWGAFFMGVGLLLAGFYYKKISINYVK